jgi:hypothetical protein
MIKTTVRQFDGKSQGIKTMSVIDVIKWQSVTISNEGWETD